MIREPKSCDKNEIKAVVHKVDIDSGEPQKLAPGIVLKM